MEWSTITTAMTNFTGLLDTVITTVTANAYLAVFLCSPLFAMGCRAFRRLTRVAR